MDYAERIAEVYGMTPAEAEQIERELAEWEDEKQLWEDEKQRWENAKCLAEPGEGWTVKLEY